MAPPDRRGRYAGALGLSFGFASFAAPIVGSAVLEAGGSATLWLSCLGACAAVAAGYSALGRRLPARLSA